MTWILPCIRKDYLSAQTGLKTWIFGQFLYFYDLQPFVYKNFEAHDMKTGLFGQYVWRGHVCLRTRNFGQFLHFHDLQRFTYLWQKNQICGSWHENWPFSSGLK